ncbi:TPA: inverse autotransporter beta domain-containing protein [Escherichia coli]|nr:invasin [Escherichia coli]
MRKTIGYSMVAVQFFAQISPAFAGVFQADEQSVAQTAMEAGRVLQGSNSGDAARQLLTSQASGQAADAVTQWLNQFGTAKTQLSVDSDFSLKGSSLDVLLPFYNTPKNVLFTQLGMRDNDGRFTTNAGLGHRYFTDNGWMLGYNVFYDVDWRNTNRRYGIGVEAWRDYLKVSANGYKRLSDWRQSPTVTDYDERPADGWDIRAEGWLPAYPQLGGKLVYEQYYGNEVALFGESERQKNPHAITAGVTWTPFPLLTAGVDYRRGKNGADDTRLNLGLTYRIGEPLAHQLDSSRVGAQRSLVANRLELVNRNNDVVLEYRKQTLITLQLPPDVYGAELTTVPLTPQVNAKYGLSRIELDDAELRQAGGKIISNTSNRITLQLPAWSAENQSVTLSGRARDTRGNLSDIARTRILVSPAVQQQLADRTQALADGQEAVSYTLTLRTTDGKPLSGKNVTFTTTAGQLSRTQGTTDQNGQLSVQLTSTRAGQAVVNASVDGTTISAAPVTFENHLDSAIVVNKTSAVADGQDSIILTAVIRDAAGIPVAGQAVTWHTDNGQFTQQDAVTNAAGAASATLTSTQAGNAQVSLSLNGTTTTVSAPRVSFTQQLYLTLQAGRTTAVADGNDAITYTLNVRDAAGQPVKDKAVQWSTDLGALSTLQGTTSAQGEATVTLTSTQAGQAVVNATVDGRAVSAQSVTFTRTVRGVITVEKERVYPGSRQTVTLTLTDAAGNPVSGERVDWHTDSGRLWQTQGTTDAQGRATTTWESTTPGTATITADAYGQQYTAPVITVMPALTVSSVTGIDATGADGQNFGKRVPDNTWPGAKFRIDTENAAGTVTWTASSPAVSINGNVMTVKSNPAGVTLTGTDADGQTVTLNMGSSWFAQSATESGFLNIDVPGSAIHTCKALNAGVATESQLSGIISEWGELQKYPGWTSLASNWLYSSTTVILSNGRTYYRAFYLPQSVVSELSGPGGYYACR